ncbi:hypothetical protein L7F22_033379 [Adiantum nelumboides]|nr:hypothetical protein [Adiantum nelumboides]
MKSSTMTVQSNDEAPKSGRAPLAAFYWVLFTVWSLFFTWKVITQHRVDLWPILAGLLASLVARLALRCFSTSPLFSNTAVSLLAAALGGFSAAWMAYNEWHSKGWSSLTNNYLLIHKPWQGAHFLLCSYMGYLFFDVFDVLLANLHDKLPYILFHHTVVLIAFSTLILYDYGYNYLILFLICEIHSTVAYLRCLLRMLGQRRDGTLYVKGEWGFHWVSYVIARLALHILICIKVALNWPSISVLMDWPIWQWPVMVSWILGMNIWNINLAGELYRAFLREVYGVGKSLKVT